MTITYVLMQNLKRNPLRTMLTATAFALPMAVFVAAVSFVVALSRLSAASQKELRLAVHSKTTIINMLPEALRRRIESLDPDHTRVRAVCGMRWFGGRVPNAPNTITSLAADADTFPLVYGDIAMTDDEITAWQREHRAACIGSILTEQYGWKLGDRITLESTVPPYLSLEFRIVKIMDLESRRNVMYLRRDYLDESLKTAGAEYGRVNVFWVKCNSADGLHSLQKQIDSQFANTPDETKSEDENAFIANFTQAAGNIPGLMQAMALVVVFIISLVAGNTMMMSFRERTRELGVFRAIGFQSRRIFFIVLAESVLLATLGALLGIVPAALVIPILPLSRWSHGMLAILHTSPVAIVVSLLIAVCVGLVAGAWPAYQAMRMRTVDALRRVA